ncbi:MAG: ABC transporter ATP-binding protein [Acetobacter sp.]|jgi:lipopolysaccharide transport system ATP-binding protein|nr:ABC transporter ATP-binding protein [Acetobacter sp.]
MTTFPLADDDLPTRSASITAHDLSLSFPLFHGGARSLKKSLFGKAKKTIQKNPARTGGEVGLAPGETGVLEVRALSNLTFSIASGERIGLIGHNGAGKTTLLRVLGGIFDTPPEHLTVHGNVVSLIDTGSGMNRELTGRENIMLHARHRGLTSAQQRQLEEDVEQFANLGHFLNLPVRLYSSGMAVRLGFGLATAISPQILLMDEWFMAGDAQFQASAKERLSSVVKNAEILVITSHNLPILLEWCTRIIWLEGGRIKMDGPTEEVIKTYQTSVTEELGE